MRRLRRLGRLIALLGAALGGFALYRRLARRARRRVLESPGEAGPSPGAGPDPRADELRQRLEESRAIVDERDAFEEAETPVDVAEPAADPDERRRRVHEAGRASVERMRRSRDT